MKADYRCKLLYRGLSHESAREWITKKIQTPKPGNLATGTGICWTSKEESAIQYAAEVNGSKILLVTNRALLDPERRAIDTRNKGYSDPIKKLLNARLKTYNGYTLWDEICKYDTILPDGNEYVYVSRRNLGLDQILKEVKK